MEQQHHSSESDHNRHSRGRGESCAQQQRRCTSQMVCRCGQEWRNTRLSRRGRLFQCILQLNPHDIHLHSQLRSRNLHLLLLSPPNHNARTICGQSTNIRRWNDITLQRIGFTHTLSCNSRDTSSSGCRYIHLADKARSIVTSFLSIPSFLI